METIALQPDLMEQIRWAVDERDVMPEELLEDAVRAFLRQMEREQLQLERQAFRALHSDLVTTHLGEYVAVYRGSVVDADGEFVALHQRIRRRYGRQPVLLRKVEASPDRSLVFRSPRIRAG